VGETEINVLRDQYAATNERDWKRVMSHYADVVELIIPGGTLQSGTFTGKEAVGEWFGDWMRTFDRDLHFELREIIELDDGSILVIAENRARGRASGIAVEMPVFWRYWLRDGKIVRLRGFQSREQAMAGEER
jgi:ketosteroid isomerase-like protein